MAYLVPLLVGIALLGLAVPRTMAAWASVEADSTLEKLRQVKGVAGPELDAASAALQRGLAWHRLDRRLVDLGLIEFNQARRLRPQDPKRAVVLQSAEQHTIEGLLANPGDGYGWLGLAQIKDLRAAPKREVADAVTQSLDMAPNARPIWIPRATLFFTCWQVFKDDELDAVKRQLRTVWAFRDFQEPLFFAALVPGLLEKLYEALPDDAEGRERFERKRQELLPAPTLPPKK